MKREGYFAGVLAAAAAATPAVAQAPTIGVNWWVAHRPQLQQELSWCRDHPGQAGGNCVNAEAARDRITIGNMPTRTAQATTHCSPIERMIYRCDR